jgi:small membrane protein
MRLGQLILLAGVIGFAVYTTRVRSTLSDRLIYVVLIAAGIPLVLYPDWSTRLAHLVGIGRGADLVIYLFIMFSLFFFASSASAFREIERELTVVVRTIAINNAAVGAVERLGGPPHIGAHDALSSAVAEESEGRSRGQLSGQDVSARDL